MFTLGLDGLDITINTDVKLEQNHYVFKNQTGKEIGNLVAVKNGYMIIPGLSEPPVRTLRATCPENESHIFR